MADAGRGHLTNAEKEKEMTWENDIIYSSPNCPKCGMALADSGRLDVWGLNPSVKHCFGCKSAFRLRVQLHEIGIDGEPFVPGEDDTIWIGDGRGYECAKPRKEGQ